ncbi:MAG: PolC-type DNA polymerase III [Oscillospiraceae bacterium]|jgi:DNA polymerase-3 subunit alpha (Gram-positive type)|nr:PolC-type DNA polymerase III [Oscillospiraceae bacterium]
MAKLDELLKKAGMSEKTLDCDLISADFEEKRNVLTLRITSESPIGFGELSGCEKKIKEFLGASDVRIIPESKRELPPASDIPPVHAVLPAEREPAGGDVVVVKKPLKTAARSENPDLLFGREIKEPPVPMSELTADGDVTVWGKVFEKETRTLKNGKNVALVSFTDGTSSRMLKFFSDGGKTAAEKRIKNGVSLLAQGKYKYDEFEKTNIIEPVSLTLINPPERADCSEKKRCELHLHTKMSDMDAVNSAGEYVELAYKWGHRAVAITDHGNVQAFPEAMDTYERIKQKDPEADFKVIYGTEAYFVNDGTPLISSGARFLLNGEFIVLDVETTGLSQSSDRITEIGAVRLKNMEIAEKFHTFVNPETPIPDSITALTGITDDMVRDAPYEKEAFAEFIKFCGGGSVALIAHNAPFDAGFLRAGFNRCGLEYDYAEIDTLPLCRAAVPNRKHGLGEMAKYFKLGEFNHHRAVDDAETTARLFVKIVAEAGRGRVLERAGDLNAALGGVDVKKEKYFHQIILVKNKTGLKNLYKLVSFSNLNYFYKKPRIPLSELKNRREGLIIGSACEQGELFRAVLDGKPWETLLETAKFYDYLEIQPSSNNAFLVRRGDVDSELKLQAINKKIFDIGKALGKPVVATCDVHFMNPGDFIFREILQTGQGYSDASSQAPLYMRTTKEMLEEFSYLGEDGAYEIVVENPNKIADMVEDVRPVPKGTYTPNIKGADKELEQLCRKRAEKLYGGGGELPETVAARLDKELNAIIKYGFAVLYIIAHKLVKKSEEDGYLVGSRGSVGSSFVANLAGISEVNPLPPHYRCKKCGHTEFVADGSVGSGYDLPKKACPACGEDLERDGHDIPFETFLGFKGDKAPDIDLNFSGEYQPRAHKYTEELFGRDYVFRAGTISAIQSKTAFGFVKKFEEERGVTFDKAEINRLVAGCVGVKRTTSQHPGGMVVIPKEYEVYDFTPVQRPADDDSKDIITTHFDFHALHDTVLKLDELGHDVPTLYKRLEDMTGVKIADVPPTDERVMKLFVSPEPLKLSENDGTFSTGTYGLPEFGTPFVLQMLKEARPKTFADLLQISGLSHGTDVWIGNARDLITEGKRSISEVIGTRDNIMVYLIRKGMKPSLAFKITEITRKGKASEQFDEEIYREFKECGVPAWYVESCKKIKYMFPKAHAAAYVTGAVKLGWFKVYYPREFYAAVLAKHTDNIEVKTVLEGKDAVKARLRSIAANPDVQPKEKAIYDALLIVYEMLLRGIKLLPACYKNSHPVMYNIEETPEKGLRLPYAAIEGCGESAARRLSEVIGSGDFVCVDDIQNKSGLNKTVMEKLTDTGFFGGLPQSAQISLFEL